MMDKAKIKKGIGDTLKPHGFVGKGQAWYLEGSEVIVVLGLQKSDFDEKYYINFGIWLKEVAEAIFPPDNKCHIQGRLASLLPDDAKIIDRACRIDSEASAWLGFTDLLERKVVPLCRDFLQMDQLRMMLGSGLFKRSLVMKSARDIFGF